MKIDRYTRGASNVSLLREQQDKSITPGQAAEAANAPYAAVANIAGQASDALIEYNEVKLKTEDADDLSKLAIAKQEAEAQRKLANKQAEAENWAPEQLQERHDEIIRNFMSTTESLTPRNQAEFSEQMGRQAASWLALSDVDATVLRTEQTAERMDSAINLAFTNKNWDEFQRLNEVAFEGQMQTESQYLQNQRNMDAVIKSESMMEDYRKARQAGTEDAYLMSLSNKDLSPETMKAFGAEKKAYDSLTKQVETELKTERAIAISTTTQEITADTTDDALIQRFKELKLTDYGILNSWYKKRQSEQKANEVINSTELDPFNKSDRKALNTFVTSASSDPQEQFNTALALSVDSRIAPQWLDTYFNKGALNNIQETGENWIRYQQASDGVPLGVDADAVERYEYYSDMRKGMGPQEAAQTVEAYYDGMNNDRITANRKAWTDKRYGDGSETPADMIESRLTELLEDSEEATLAVQGFFGDTVPEYPAEMRRFIDRVSQSGYGNTANIESTANTLYRLIKQSGWQVSTINDGISSGDQEIGPNWMQKPPSRGTERTRAELTTDIRGVTFFVNGEQKELDPDSVEIYTYKQAPDGSDAWRLRVDGDLVYNLNGTPALFQYAQPTADEDEPVTSTAVDLIERAKAEDDKKRTRANAQQGNARAQLISATPGI